MTQIYHPPSLLVVEYLSLDQFLLNEDNPKKHNRKQNRQIAASFKKYKVVVPIIIDGENNVIAGHGRIMVARELGIEKLPAIRLTHLTDAEKAALALAENKITENGEWDPILLAKRFQLILKLDFTIDPDSLGFSRGEIDCTIEGAEPVQLEELDDQLPAVIAKRPVTQLGFIWLLGPHRIYCGNSLEDETFAILMDGKKASMVFIDGPYNVRVHGHVSGLGNVKHREFAMASGEMTKTEYIAFLVQAFKLLAKYSHDGSIVFSCIDWRHIAEMLEAGDQVFIELKNICVWVKDNGGMGSFYRSRHELVCVFKNGTVPHKNNFELGQHGRYRTNVWEYTGINSFARETEEGNLLELHPTVKPISMVADAIMDCSDHGDIILDSFLGSGTTLLAAERTGRTCYAMEIDPLYVDTAIRRWQAMTGLKAIHAESNKSFDELEGEMEVDHE